MTSKAPGPDSLIGKTLGHYQVLERLGGGGMGVVYKAEDTKLRRTVALKILLPERLGDPNRVRRFIQEARAASALNHPNIIVIHDIDEADGVHFIAMEYVAGKTLDHLIGPRGLSLNCALKYAVQMAAALAKAHSAGIVHRDLKPANVIVADDGLVKLLDFGLAKLTEASPLGEAETVATLPPATEEGTIVGTVGYMSPEQAEGKAVDARSDVFSFGSVLYEMLTGQRAFEGETKASTIAAILREEPRPLSQAAKALPREIERLVRRCLRKDREHRFQTMADLKVALEELKEESDSGELATKIATGLPGQIEGGRVKPLLRGWTFAVAAAGLAAVIGAAIGYRYVSKPPLPPMRIVPFTTFPGHQGDARFSPDGKQIVFAWDGEKQDNWDIYVKLIGTEKPLRLTTDPLEDVGPVWSPDGRYLAFWRGSDSEAGIYIIPALGGSERKVHAATGGLLDLGSLDWSPDGKYLVYADRQSGREFPTLFLLAVDSPNDKRALTAPEGHWDSDPRFSPDGQMVAFLRNVGGLAREVFLVRTAGGQPKRLTFDNVITTGPAWTPDGHSIIFSSDRLGGRGRLWKVSASGGEPEPLPVGQGDAFSPALSRDGHRLAYTHSESNVSIWKHEVPRVSTRSTPPTRLISSAGGNWDQQFSPDGKKIAFQSGRSGSFELWVCDSDGSNPRQLTFTEKSAAMLPRWSPDGQGIAFTAELEGHDAIYVVSAEGGQPRRLTTDTSNELWPWWSGDGKWIYFSSDKTGSFQLWRMPADGGPALQVTRKGGWVAREAPDGKALYYSKGRDIAGIWKAPVEGGEETLLLDQPPPTYFGVWDVTVNSIYFYNASTKAIESLSLASDRITQIMKVEIGPFGRLAVSPDGRWILYSQVDQRTSNIMLVENFKW